MDFEELQKCAREIYRKAGKLNLYITHCSDKNQPDTVRLKNEIDEIKISISRIESQTGVHTDG